MYTSQERSLTDVGSATLVRMAVLMHCSRALEEWNQTYEGLSEYVVPRSSK